MLHFNVTLRGGETLPRCLPIVPVPAEEQTGIKIHRRRLEIHRNDELGRYKSQYRHGFVSFRFVPLFFLPFPFFFFYRKRNFHEVLIHDRRDPENVKAHLRLAGKFHSARARFVPTRSIRSLEIARPDPVFSRNRHAPRKID